MATRGFVGRRPTERDPRLPPGQYDTGKDFPVLTAEVTPRLDPDRWTMTVDGLVDNEHTWSWADLHALPQSEYRGDIHCVTTWSKLDTSFGGVSVDVLLDAAGPEPEAGVVGWRRLDGGPPNPGAGFFLPPPPPAYPPTLPLEHVRDGKAWIVWTHEGRPLP